MECEPCRTNLLHRWIHEFSRGVEGRVGLTDSISTMMVSSLNGSDADGMGDEAITRYVPALLPIRFDPVILP